MHIDGPLVLLKLLDPFGLSALRLCRNTVYVSSVFFKQFFRDTTVWTKKAAEKGIVVSVPRYTSRSSLVVILAR